MSIISDRKIGRPSTGKKAKRVIKLKGSLSWGYDDVRFLYSNPPGDFYPQLEAKGIDFNKPGKIYLKSCGFTIKIYDQGSGIGHDWARARISLRSSFSNQKIYSSTKIYDTDIVNPSEFSSSISRFVPLSFSDIKYLSLGIDYNSGGGSMHVDELIYFWDIVAENN